MEANDVRFTVYDNTISGLKEDIKDLQKRISEVENSKGKTEFQYEEIMKSLTKLNDITIPNLLKEIEGIKYKPAKRYESIVSAFISGIVAIIVSFLFKGLGN